MLILGLTTFIQNPAACILRDGQLIAFAEEERFIRLKGAEGHFPARAVNYCLEEAGASLKEVDKIAVGWNFEKYRFKMPLFFFFFWWRYGRRAPRNSYGTVLNEIVSQQPEYIRRRIKFGLRNSGHAGKVPPIEFISHHLAHAASAYYASGFDHAAILVMDGSGEERSTSLYLGKENGLYEQDYIILPDSLGWFYASISAYLGFTPYLENGFLMGLAPYGKFRRDIAEKIEQVLQLDSKGKYRLDPIYTLLGSHDYHEHFSNQLVELLGPPRLREEPIKQRHKDIAYACQNLLEKAVLALASKATKEGSIRRLCLAGGVALNCKANGVLARSGLIDEIFVQPVSHDAGSALGAAMIVAQNSGDNPRFKMKHVRWGPKFSPSEVKKILDEAGVKFSKPKSIEKTTAEAIARGKIVAWFNGRMEVGPRALGARSILADPSKARMKDLINARVKHRDPWRPFCPSIIEETSHQYLDGLSEKQEESAFMTVAYQVFENRRKKIPAVIHVDGSTRPQTVNRNIDRKYHNLIKIVGDKTGVPVILNTSLNIKGEPIVCTPHDALRCFSSSGLDALAIEGFWLEKPQTT